MADDRILGPIVRAMNTTRPTRTALRGSRPWRSHRDGSRPRVLCVGFQKTGTSSFGVAMRQLGFCHDGYDRDLHRALQAGEVKPRLLRMNICAGEVYETLCPFPGLPDQGVPFAWANRGQA